MAPVLLNMWKTTWQLCVCRVCVCVCSALIRLADAHVNGRKGSH